MLSTIAEASAENQMMISMASPSEWTFSTTSPAMLAMTPVSTRAPTTTKSPPKKKRAGHSIFSKIASGDCLLQTRRIAAPIRATRAGSRPSRSERRTSR